MGKKDVSATKKATKKTLSLKRDVLRNLTTAQLTAVLGGSEMMAVNKHCGHGQTDSQCDDSGL